MKAILATCVRNEGPYLLEWIAYYRLLGFEKIYIYSNDNTDGSGLLLDKLDSHGYIIHRPRNLNSGESPQLSAYKDLSSELLSDSSHVNDFLCWLDCDEYLVLPKHNDILDFICAYNVPDAIFLNWKHFGSSGKVKYEKKLTIDRFTKCSSANDINKKYKVICKLNPDKVTVINNHRPVISCPSTEFRAVIPVDADTSIAAPQEVINGSAYKIKDSLELYYDVCQLNHYAVRSLEEYSWKKDRGNGRTPLNSSKSQFKDIYFDKHDLNTDHDTWLSDKYSILISKAVECFPKDILIINKKIIDGYINRNINMQEYTSSNYLSLGVNSSPYKKLDIDVSRKIAGFNFINVILNKSVINTEEAFDCNGVVLHDSIIDDIFLLSTSGITYKANIGLRSPVQGKNYPHIAHSARARFNFQDSLDLDFGDYELIAVNGSSKESIATIKVSEYEKSDFVSGSMKVDFYRLATRIKTVVGNRKVYYMANPGNWGDGLIRSGAINFLRDFNIDYVEIKDQDIDSIVKSESDYADAIFIYGGGGAWGNTHSGGYNRVKKLYNTFKHTIVLPSTFERKISSNKITYFSRGLDYSIVMANGNFCHDMAFYIGSFDCLTGCGTADYYRTDNESSGVIDLPVNNLDISLLGATFAPPEEFFSYILPYEYINTDRLHVAVAAALLGKKVNLYSNSYFKIDEVYHATFKYYFPLVNMISKSQGE